MDVLHSEEPDKTIQKPPKQHKVNTTVTKFTKEYSTPPKGTCKMFSSTSHAIHLCPDFKVYQWARELISSGRTTYNCLAYGHAVRDCRNTMTCRHLPFQTSPSTTPGERYTVNATVANLNTADSSRNLMMTCQVVAEANGRRQKFRYGSNYLHGDLQIDQQSEGQDDT